MNRPTRPYSNYFLIRMGLVLSLVLSLVIVTTILSASRVLHATTEGQESFSLGSFGVWEAGGRRFVRAKKLITSLSKEERTLVMVSFIPSSLNANKLKTSENTMAYFSSTSTGIGRAVVALNSEEMRESLAADAHNDINACGGIEDLDLSYPLVSLADGDSPIIATTAKSSAVATLVDQVSVTNLESTVSTLQNLGTRYHAGTSPNTASNTIKSLFEANTPTAGTALLVDHSAAKSTTQKSVVLTIPGTTDTSKTIIIAAHLDSINHADETNAPGADDNASGVAALTEILRILKANNSTFQRNVEIHAYAAEEIGLLGSADLAAQAAAASKKVPAMLQLDMIGYSATANDKTMHLITTDTSPVLVRHLKDLVSSYLDGTWETGTLAAGTSDHKSWTVRGYHAAFAFEHPTNYNHKLHSASDTKAIIDFNLAGRFTKLALAFLAHEAGLTTGVADTATTWAGQKQTSDSVKLSISTSSTGGYRVAATVPDTTLATTAEFCKVSANAEIGCQSLNTETTIAKTASGKIFFLTTADVSISEGQLWRFNAYDAKGLLVAMRTVQLKKK
jgi:Zn-dependent M28 family amino/carboxypeptidase